MRSRHLIERAARTPNAVPHGTSHHHHHAAQHQAAQHPPPTMASVMHTVEAQSLIPSSGSSGSSSVMSSAQTQHTAQTLETLSLQTPAATLSELNEQDEHEPTSASTTIANDETDDDATSPLLREWTATTVATAPAHVVLEEVPEEEEQDTSTTTIPEQQPITDETERRDSNSSQYTYPVATFVRDLVRTSMDQLYAPSQEATGAQPASASASRMPPTGIFTPGSLTSLSVRSEGGFRSGQGEHHVASATVRTLDDLGLEDDAEFILVDGDLVALPPIAPNEIERDELEYQLRDQVTQSCQPSRVKRGVRKISKWMKKRRASRGLTMSRDASVTSQESQDASQGDHYVQQQQQHQTQPNQSSISPKRRPRRRDKRRSWRRTDSNNGSDDQDENEEGHEVSLHTDSTEHLPSTISLNMQASSSVARLPSMSPIHEAPMETSASSRAQSVTASFVGTADQVLDQVLEAAVLPAGMAAAEAYIEFDEKKDDGATIMTSLVPPDADYKVDKAAAPDVEYMLRRAAHDTATDFGEGAVPESSMLSPLRFQRRGKSDGSSVPLSQAIPSDPAVHNDILKVVMVAAPQVDKSRLSRAIRETNKQPRKRKTLGVDVHTWQPDETADVRCQIWDIQGATTAQPDSANFGAHAGTQSLFFSAKSLYLLVWDLAASNPKTMRYEHLGDGDDSEDEDDDFLREEANRQADRALYADIQTSVLSWVDCIAQRGPNSAILPITVIPEGMDDAEAKRRCDMMQHLLEQHPHCFAGDARALKLLTGADSMLCVNYAANLGVKAVQEMILAIATDASRSVFDHVGTPVPRGTMEVLEMTRRLKQDHKLVLLDHFIGGLGSLFTIEEIVEALHFLSSIGEILYFGTAGDEVLSRYIILSRKWLVSALSCILRNDLKRELSETRRFMNMQCLYSDQKYSEDDVTKALVSGNASSCPLLSDSDALMLWQSMSFMREAADRHSQLTENSTTTPTMFQFLERLLVHAGIFLPLGSSSLNASLDHSNSEVFFIPSLLAQADPRDVWTYKSSESWMTTLCHSWLFRDGAPSNLMEHITVTLLKDLYGFSREFNDRLRSKPPHRSQTLPIGMSSLHEFVEDHDDSSIGRIKINHIMCWKSSLLVKISSVFADHESGELRESFVEVFVSIVDQSSSHCVASDAMRASMQRVIVSGKGQIGHQGRKLWKGGYEVCLSSVRKSLENYANVDSQVICPECLAHSSPHSACTWSWDSVLAVAESGSSVIRCMRGHRANTNLLCGICRASEEPAPALESAPSLRKTVSDLLPSVVLVGLWDASSKSIKNVGSGFVVDKKLGLIVTAGHILFDMEEGRQFGSPFFGLRNAKVVIGVIPDDGHKAVFRYFADIVADDIHNVDACVVRITTRLEHDVNDAGAACGDEAELVLDDLTKEQLKSLKMTSRFELEESVRILGFNQGGEGVFEQGKHVNRSADFAKGYVCTTFKASVSDDSSGHSSDSSSQCNFSPREEIVIMCPTISGHSGGACVNDDGKVVGILSRADPVDRQRCYLVPSTELKSLVNQAKKHCARPSMLKSLQTM